MAFASPCPVCGGRIRPGRPDARDFDCPSRCRARDRKTWDDARAAQLAAELDALLHGGRDQDEY